LVQDLGSVTRSDLRKYRKDVFDDSFRLDIEVEKRLLSFGSKCKVKLRIEKQDFFSLDEQSEINYIEFNASKEYFNRDVQTKIFEYLISNRIRFNMN
jgi:hypothetical protein